MRRNKVGHNVGLVHRLGQRSQLIGQRRREANSLVKKGGNGTLQRFELFFALAFGGWLVDEFDSCAQVGLFGKTFDNSETLDSLNDESDGVIHLYQRADDDGAAVLIDAIEAGFVERRVSLGNNSDDSVGCGNGFVNQLNAILSGDGERCNQHWIDDAISERKDAELFGDYRLGLLVFGCIHCGNCHGCIEL